MVYCLGFRAYVAKGLGHNSAIGFASKYVGRIFFLPRKRKGFS